MNFFGYEIKSIMEVGVLISFFGFLVLVLAGVVYMIEPLENFLRDTRKLIDNFLEKRKSNKWLPTDTDHLQGVLLFFGIVFFFLGVLVAFVALAFGLDA